MFVELIRSEANNMLKEKNALKQYGISTLRGVGPKLTERLNKLHIYTIEDLLLHLPARYEDRTQISPINRVRLEQRVVVDGEIINASLQYGRRRSLVVEIADSTGVLMLRFFYFNAAQQKQLSQVGMRIRCYGEVRFSGRNFAIIHPEYRVYKLGDTLPIEENLTPVYPSTEGLHQASWRQLIAQALTFLKGHEPDDELAFFKEWGYPSYKEALTTLHNPPVNINVEQIMSAQHPCQQRLILEELIAHRLSMLSARQHRQKYYTSAFCIQNNFINPFLGNLLFTLTGAQQRVFEEIKIDVQKNEPMLRLVQGDVGSGKTVVAALAMLLAVENGKQAAMMAPTELLAEQHLKRFLEWFSPLGVRVTWLSGSLTGKARKNTLYEIISGDAQIIIGTHAIFQEGVEYKDLGLVVIDEQHRFGVHQRLALWQKGQAPHQLVMTATPIPRTLAMISYADLDSSVIDELPPGRQSITTVVIDNNRREEIISRVREHCATGQQVYWVCPLIQESEVLEAQAAEQVFEALKHQLPALKIRLVHGRMTAAEKENIMQEFKSGDVQLLVATTVIEVGVDVSNATLMIIENAERMGLAQLHQLRGRVGRGTEKSFCVLMYQGPLSETAKERLQILRESQDGFLIAQKDLEIRGPGEVLGTRQTGLLPFKIADLQRDAYLLSKVQHATDYILAKAPDLVDELQSKWISTREQYLQA